jgi:hypothetical protein
MVVDTPEPGITDGMQHSRVRLTCVLWVKTGFSMGKGLGRRMHINCERLNFVAFPDTRFAGFEEVRGSWFVRGPFSVTDLESNCVARKRDRIIISTDRASLDDGCILIANG